MRRGKQLVAGLDARIAQQDDRLAVVPQADDHRLVVVGIDPDLRIGDAEDLDADTVDVEALAGIVQVHDIGRTGGQRVERPVIAASIAGLALPVEVAVRHPGLDDLVNGYPLRVLQDLVESAHVVAVRM